MPEPLLRRIGAAAFRFLAPRRRFDLELSDLGRAAHVIQQSVETLTVLAREAAKAVATDEREQLGLFSDEIRARVRLADSLALALKYSDPDFLLRDQVGCEPGSQAGSHRLCKEYLLQVADAEVGEFETQRLRFLCTKSANLALSLIADLLADVLQPIPVPEYGRLDATSPLHVGNRLVSLARATRAE